MSPRRLRILYLSQLPSSPPRFGAQARMHGLMTALARKHDLTAITLADEDFDVEEARRAMRAYCDEVVIIRNPRGRNGASKRALQLRSLASLHSFEHHRYTVSALNGALEEIHRRIRFDVVNLEFPYLAHHRPTRAASGHAPPPLLIDAHEIAYDMVRQFGRSGGVGRKVYSALNWRKLRFEERAAFRSASGVYVCSQADRDRVVAEVPGTRTAVVPNAADVEFYRPPPSGAAGDGRTVLFFGLLSTLPNIDGVLWFSREVWPRIATAHPEARLKILGKGAPPVVQGLSGPGIEVVGFVDDLRPELASAAVLVVPLRLGGGTRLKIVEGMAMGKAIVSTTLGAEGIEAVPGEQLLIADEPASFAASVLGLLADPGLARRIGVSARRLAEDRYSWTAAAAVLDGFLRQFVEARE